MINGKKILHNIFTFWRFILSKFSVFLLTSPAETVSIYSEFFLGRANAQYAVGLDETNYLPRAQRLLQLFQQTLSQNADKPPQHHLHPAFVAFLARYAPEYLPRTPYLVLGWKTWQALKPREFSIGHSQKLWVQKAFFGVVTQRFAVFGEHSATGSNEHSLGCANVPFAGQT